MMHRAAQRMPLAAAAGGGLADRGLDELRVFGHRALPAGDQTGERVDHERGVAEPALAHRRVREIGHPQGVGPLRGGAAVHQVRGAVTWSTSTPRSMSSSSTSRIGQIGPQMPTDPDHDDVGRKPEPGKRRRRKATSRNELRIPSVQPSLIM
jgi:hypothetical protein